MKENTMKYTVKDPVSGKELEINVSAMGGILEIRPVGYGEPDATDGHGSPVFLDYYDSKLTVRISPDINTENQISHSLEGAREDQRI